MKKIPVCFGSLILGVLTPTMASAQEPAPATPAAAVTPAPATDPAVELTAATEKLVSSKSYAWTQTTSFANMGDRTTTGKKGSGGYLLVNIPGRDEEIQVLARKGKAALKGDDGWTVANAEAGGGGGGGGGGQGRGNFVARMARNLREPVVEAKELVAKVSGLKSENGTYSGTLSEEAAKELMTFGGGRRGGGGGFTPPPITGAGGTIKFTVANGVLTGYEFTLTGKMEFNGEEREMNRTTKVQFTGLGSTSFEIPEAAAGLLAE